MGDSPISECVNGLWSMSIGGHENRRYSPRYLSAYGHRNVSLWLRNSLATFRLGSGMAPHALDGIGESYGFGFSGHDVGGVHETANDH